MFSVCVFSVCVCVFSLCVFCLCVFCLRLRVFSVCVFCLCVFCLCVFSLCFLSVRFVFSLCFLVFSVCVFFSLCVFLSLSLSLCGSLFVLSLSVFFPFVPSLCVFCQGGTATRHRRELSPALPRDRRKYQPLYYSGLAKELGGKLAMPRTYEFLGGSKSAAFLPGKFSTA